MSMAKRSKKSRKSAVPKKERMNYNSTLPDPSSLPKSIKNLPDSLADRVAMVLKEVTAPQKIRLLEHILASPGSYTHQIASACGIGFPPARAFELNTEVLPRYRLHLLCHPPAKWLRNRWGAETRVHKWTLVMVKEKKGLPSRNKKKVDKA